MFILLVSYRADRAARERVLPEHHAFLERQYAAGRFVASGPLDDGRGAIVATGDDAAELRAVLDGDPFVVEGVATYEVLHLRATRSASDDLPLS